MFLIATIFVLYLIKRERSQVKEEEVGEPGVYNSNVGFKIQDTSKVDDTTKVDDTLKNSQGDYSLLT